MEGARRNRALSRADQRQAVLPSKYPAVMSGKETMTALADCESRGVRGGAVYDFLHLAVARKAGVARVLTLDIGHFQALSRPGDPPIEAP